MVDFSFQGLLDLQEKLNLIKEVDKSSDTVEELKKTKASLVRPLWISEL